MRAAALVLFVVSLVVAGCSGQARPAETNASTAQGGGSVAGTVTDDSGLPIEAAEAALVDAQNVTAQSAADGRFLLTGVAPGRHQLVVHKLGFSTGQRSIEVSDGQVLELEVTLVAVPRPLDTPPELRQGRGFISCSFTSNAFAPTVTQPCGWDDNNEPLYIFDVDVTRGLVAVVSELVWTPTSGGTGQELRLGLWRNPSCEVRCSQEDGKVYGYVNGHSPLRFAIGNMTEPFRDGLESTKPTRLGAVALVRDPHPVAQDPADVALVWQQPVDFWVTIFYNQEAPAGYSALPK